MVFCYNTNKLRALPLDPLRSLSHCMLSFPFLLSLLIQWRGWQRSRTAMLLLCHSSS